MEPAVLLKMKVTIELETMFRQGAFVPLTSRGFGNILVNAYGFFPPQPLLPFGFELGVSAGFRVGRSSL